MSKAWTINKDTNDEEQENKGSGTGRKAWTVNIDDIITKYTNGNGNTRTAETPSVPAAAGKTLADRETDAESARQEAAAKSEAGGETRDTEATGSRSLHDTVRATRREHRHWQPLPAEEREEREKRFREREEAAARRKEAIEQGIRQRIERIQTLPGVDLDKPFDMLKGHEEDLTYQANAAGAFSGIMTDAGAKAEDTGLQFADAVQELQTIESDLQKIISYYGAQQTADGSVTFPSNEGAEVYNAALRRYMETLEESGRLYDEYAQADKMSFNAANMYGRASENVRRLYSASVEESNKNSFGAKPVEEQTDEIYRTLGKIEGFYTMEKADSTPTFRPSSGLPAPINYTGEWQTKRDPETAAQLWDDLQQQLAYVLFSGKFAGIDAQKVAERVYAVKAEYENIFDEEDPMRTAADWAFGNTAEEFMAYFYYEKEQLTPEAIPYRSTEDLTQIVARYDPKMDSTRMDNAEIGKDAVVGVGSYLANIPVSEADERRILQVFGELQEKYGDDPVVTGWIEARRKNGLMGNQQGLQQALSFSLPEQKDDTEAPSFWEVAGGALGLGSEMARENIFLAGEALDQLTTHLSGYMWEGIGSLLYLLGFEDAGEALIEKGEKDLEYREPHLAESQRYIASRQAGYAEVTQRIQNKTLRLLADMAPGLVSSALQMGASHAAGAFAQMSSGSFTSAFGYAGTNTSRALNATQYDALTRAMGYGIKRAGLFAMSGNAAINTYASKVSSGDEPWKAMIYGLADGAAEFGSELVFGGNPLLDSGEAGAFTRLVYRLTDDGSFSSITKTWLECLRNGEWGALLQKFITSGAFDMMGEGFEEIISSVGMMGMDYALYGKTDVTPESLATDFASGVLLSMVLTGGEKLIGRLSPINAEGEYRRIKFFTDEQQNNFSEAEKQMAVYVISYLGGDAELLKANGMTESQANKAANDFQRILTEFSQIRTTTQARAAVAEERAVTEEQAQPADAAQEQTAEQKQASVPAEQTAAPAEQTAELPVDRNTFTPDTAAEDAQSVVEAHRQMERDGTLQNRAAAEELLKTAEAATVHVQNAEATGRLTSQQAYDSELALRQVIESAKTVLAQNNTPAQTTAPVQNIEIGGMDNGRTEGITDGAQRNEGVGADQQGAAVQRSAEKATERGRNASIEVRRAVAAGEYDRASAKSLGIKGGSESETMQILRESVVDRIDALRTIRDEAAKDSVNVKFFAGTIAAYNKFANRTDSIEGVYLPDSNTVYVKADKVGRGPAQIYSHEMMHKMMQDNPGMLDYALQLLGEQYTPEELEQLVDRYCEAYHGIYGTISESMTADEQRAVYMKYIEEICADAYAGIHRGSINTTKAEQAMAAFRSDRTDGGREYAAATERTNGPGENNTAGTEDGGEVRYSIIEDFEDEDGNHYDNAVLLDTDKFGTNKPWFWADILKNEIYKRLETSTVILPVVDEKGNWVDLEYARKTDRIKTERGNQRQVLSELYRTKDNIEKLSVMQIDEVVSASEEKSPYFTAQQEGHNHDWLDRNGFLHRSAYVINAKNGDIYEVTIDIAKAEDGRVIAYAIKKNKEKIGNVALGSITNKVNGPRQNTNLSKQDNTRDTKKSQEEKAADSKYSVEDDAAELDEDYRRAVAKDAAEDEPTEKGRSFLPQRDAAIDPDYAAVATEEIERRAKEASLQQLRQMQKSSEKELNRYRWAQRKGILTDELAERMKTVEETVKIQSEELKHKNAEERKQREKRQDEEAKRQQPRIAKKELKATIAEDFHVAPGQRAITNDLIEQAANKILQRGYLDAEDKHSLFNALLKSGVVNIAPEGYYGEIRSYVQQGRIYVPESIREEFGDDWNDFRKRAWGNRIYLTNDTTDRPIDDWNQDLAQMFPGGFEEGATDMKEALEQIVRLAEEGSAENITIAEMMERNQDNYGWSVESQMEQLEEKFDRALKKFAETAKLEMRIKATRATDVLRERKRHRDMLEQARERKRLSEFQDQTLRKIQKLWKIRDKTSPFYREKIYEVLRDIDTKARSLSERGIEDLIYFESKYEEAKKSPNFIKNPYVEERISRLYEIQLDNLSLTDLVELNDIVSGILESIRTNNEMLSERFQADRKEIATMARKELEATKGSKDGFIHKFAAIEHLEPRRFFEYIFGYVKDGAGAKIAQMMEDGGINQIQYLKGGFEIFEKFTSDKDNAKWLAKASGKNAQWIEIEVPDLKATKSDLSEVPTRKIEITPMMRIALYMHGLNYANMRHIYDGGITIPNKYYYTKGKMENAVAKGVTLPISPEIIRAITAGMTEQERTFAGLLQQYFDKYSPEKINEVSLKVDGYERAKVDQYYPIKTDRDLLGKKTDELQKAVSVENYSALKERQPNAKTTIILEDACVTLADHLENMSNYYGFAIPIRDLNAVLSYNFYDEQGDLEDSVIGILKNKWGVSAEKYIDKLLKDLQGNHVTNDLVGKFFSYIRSNFAGAQLKLNPSVAVAQFASYPAATQTLGRLALLEGLNLAKRADINLIGKYTPLLWYRMQGNSTIELGDYNKDKPLEKKFPLLMNWIQGVDTLTIKRLWIASEYYVKNNTDLRPGSEADIEAGTDEFYQKVAEMFNRAVFDTQPNYSTMQRAQILRSNNELVKSVTMFMTVPIKYYNMMFEASGRLINAQRRGDKAEIREAGKYFFRTTFGLVMATLLYDFFKSFWKGIKHHGKDWIDEEGNFDIWLYIKDTFGHDFIETVAGSMVFGSALFDLGEYLYKKINKEDTAKYYGAEVNVLQWGNNIAKHAGTIVDGIANGNAKKIASGIKSLVNTGSMGAFSIPAQNAETYAISILRLFSPEAAERYENLFSDRTKSSLSEEHGRYLEAAISVYMDNRTEDLPDEVKQELQRLWEAGQKNAIPSAVPTSMKIDGEDVTLTADQKAQFREVWSRIVSDNLEDVIKSEYYQSADETTQGKMVDQLYKYATEMAKQRIDTDYQQETWARIADTRNLPEYLTYYTMSNMLDRKADEATNTAAVRAIMDYVIGGISDDDCAEIARLYMNGADGIIPKIAEDEIEYTDGDGEKKTKELDAAARNKYNEVFRDTIGNQLSALMNSPEYASAEKDRDREALIKSLIDFARDTAKKEATGLSVDDWVADGLQDMEDGISLSDYVIFRHGKNQLDSKNENGEEENGLAKKKALDLIASNDQWSTAQKASIFTDYCSETDANIANAMLRENFDWKQIQPVVAPPANSITKKVLALMALSVPDSKKLEILKVFCDEDKMNLYKTGNKFGVSFKDYAEVMLNANTNGKDDVNQDEATAYILTMGLQPQQAAFLWQMVTDAKDGKKNPFSPTFGAQFYWELHKND